MSRRGKNKGVKKGSVGKAIKGFFGGGSKGSKRGSGGRRNKAISSISPKSKITSTSTAAAGATAKVLPGINAPLGTKVEKKTVGPKTKPQKRDHKPSVKIKTAGVTKTDTPKIKTSGGGPKKIEKKSWTERAASGEGKKAERRRKRSERRMRRADRAGAKGNVAKAARLEQRAKGTRKSAVGTALSRIGRASVDVLSGGGASAYGFKRKAHEKKQKK